MKKTGAGRPKKLRPLEIQADKSEREAIDALCKFFGLTTRSRVLQHMLMFVVVDIASLAEDKSWTNEQRAAWKYCQKAADELSQAFMIAGAKKVLSTRKNSMTIHELAIKSIERIKNGEL